MSLLPQFSFDVVVQPGEGKFDKITLWIDHGICQGTINQIQLFKRALALGRIFNQPGGRPKSWMQIRRASRPGANGSPPLFTGECSFAFAEWYDPTNPNPQSARTKLRLNLNLSRFLHHQSSSDYIPPRRDFAATTATFFEADALPETDEFALDDEDNWIPDLPAFENLARPGFSDRIVRDYIEGLLREIDSDATRAADSVPVQAADFLPFWFQDDLSDKRFNVRYVETYFEFAVLGMSPPHVVSSLEPLLQSYNELGLTGKDWRFAGPQPWSGLSRVLIVKIRTGVLLRVYAKTNRRVRFEVVHDLTKASVPKLPTESIAEEARHTSPTLDGVYRILRRVRTDAAQIVNSIFEHMRNRAALPSTPKTSLRFLSDVLREVGDDDDAELILWLLIERRGVTSLPRLRSALKKLHRAGILRVQQRNRRREYVVTEQYQYPLQMLWLRGAYPHLTTRHRTRNPLASA